MAETAPTTNDLEALDLARVLHPNTNLAALHRGGPLVLVSGRLAAERVLGPDPFYRSRAWV